MKTKMTVAAALCALLVGSTIAMAKESLDKRWYIAPGVHYIFTDGDRDSDDDPGFRLGIGKAISRSWNLEVNGVIDNLSMKSSGDFKQRGLSLNALYFFSRHQFLSPYGVLGIGALETRVPGEKSTNLMAELGVGLSHSAENGIALRIEGRHRYDGDDSSISTEDNFNDWLAGLTVAIPLGKKAKEEVVQVAPAPAPAPPPAPKDDDKDGVNNDLDRCPDTPAGVKVDTNGCPVDSDRDGVADYTDNCPNTPVGVRVDSKGCPVDSDKDGVADPMDKCPDTPAGATVDASGCPADSDRDGVADYMDKCPNTPAGVKVDAKGCPSDSDNDGVMDSEDKCPNTPAGVKVDARGCPIDSDGDGVADYLDKCPGTKPDTLVDDNGCALPEKVSITLKIEFETAKADIRSKYNDKIKGVADFMNKYPSTTVEIGGHTDNVGKEAANVLLSQKRADAVKKYLVDKFGVDASRITTKGYGPSKPVADNATAAGRQQNRRVEAVIETMVRKQ